MATTTETLSYFIKHLLNRPVYDQGKAIAFEDAGGNTGVIAVDAGSPLEKLLTEKAAGRIGGIVVATEEQYNELKKNSPEAPSGKPKELLNVAGQPPKKGKKGAKASQQPPPSSAPEGAEAAASAGAEAKPEGEPLGTQASEGAPAAFVPATARVGDGAGGQADKTA